MVEEISRRGEQPGQPASAPLARSEEVRRAGRGGRLKPAGSRRRTRRSASPLLLGALALLFSLTVLSLGSCRTGPARFQAALTGSAPTPPALEPSAGGTEIAGVLRVAQLNMLHGWPRFTYLDRRLELIASELKRLRPDVVLLQEVPVRRYRNAGSSGSDGAGGAGRGGAQAGETLAAALGTSLLYARANGNARVIGFEEGEAILSRYPILEWEAHRISPQPSPFESRIVLRAVLDTPWGRQEVYDLHLSHGSRRDALRVAQVREVIRYVSSRHVPWEPPALVGGDFNAPPDSQAYRLLIAAGFVDTARAAAPTAAPTAGNPEPGGTSGIEDLRDPEQRLGRRIDYLFLYPGPGAAGEEECRCGPVPVRWRVRSAARFLERPFRVETGEAGGGWLWASDHAGLLVELIPGR